MQFNQQALNGNRKYAEVRSRLYGVDLGMNKRLKETRQHTDRI